MATTLDGIIKKATNDTIDSFDKYNVTNLLDDTFAMAKAGDILTSINNEINNENAIRKASHESTMKKQESLPLYSISELILRTHDFKIVKADVGGERLAVNAYDRHGKYTGIMQFISLQNGGKNIVSALCRKLSPNISKAKIADVVSQVEAGLADPMRAHEFVTSGNKNHHLIACNNGIWDYDTKEFTPHDSPDRWTKYPNTVFLNKMDTDWVACATKPTFRQPDGTMWDVDSFIESLFEVDTEIGRASADIIWQIIQFALRGYSGKEGHMIYGSNATGTSDGKNGKSTLFEMIMFIIDHWISETYAATHLVDPNRVVNGKKVLIASINRWAKDYILANDIQSAMFLLSDENDEGTEAIEGSGFIKNLARHQANLFNPKFGQPFTYAYQGVAVHLQNEEPQTKSTDGAMYTHRIELRFEKNFSTEAGGNPDIKDKYIIDEKVAEYILWKVTTQMECLDDYSPELLKVLKANTEETMKSNIPVERFLDEVLDDIDLGRIPAKWLYEMYDKSWRVQEGILKKLTFQKFKALLQQYIRKHANQYEYTDDKFYFKTDEQRTEEHRTVAHPALVEYGMIDEYHSLSFIRKVMVDGKEVVGGISKVAMVKQYVSGIVTKKNFVQGSCFQKDAQNAQNVA